MIEPELPTSFAATRGALHAVACYVVAPARKVRTGRIGLRSTGDGFGTPPFDDGTRIVVRGDRLVHEPGGGVAITTLRAAADRLGVALSPDPGVGHDLPPYEPDALLAVDPAASFALGAWYRFGQEVLDELRAGSTLAITEPQLWPEHFDLAVIAELGTGLAVNVGFSPGDRFHDDPYLYVGPPDMDGLTDAYWNAPFGALVDRSELVAASDPRGAALAFVGRGLSLLEQHAPVAPERIAPGAPDGG